MSDFSGLKHVRRTTLSGVRVLVLDTGALIDSEDEAMLQALQSRSNEGIEHHLHVVAEKGADKFMGTYYVGYAHKSIGDCGSTTVFIEDSSMLAPKAFQDWEVSSSQEGSTRFMNFSVQRFINPLGTKEGEKILEGWRTFYIKGMPIVVEDLKLRFPKQNGESESVYKKAIDARAFDIMRGFLPAGSATKFSWHMTLRQAADELMRLRHHPLLEVREIAEATEDALREMYPSSFSHKRYEATEEFNRRWMQENYLYRGRGIDFDFDHMGFDQDGLKEYRNILSSRQPKTELPKELGELGTLSFEFTLDMASFRDLQRHRAVTQRMPLLSTEYGFEGWYLNELPDNLQFEAETLLRLQESRISELNTSPEVSQYYIAMGYKVPCRLVGKIHSLVYLVEIRATRFVHPTLRRRALQMADHLKRYYERFGLVIHLDPDHDRFDIKRGEHDIVMKG